MWGPSRCLAFYFPTLLLASWQGSLYLASLTTGKSNFQFSPGGQLPAVEGASSAMTSIDQDF